MSQNPRDILIQQIDQKVSLFQQAHGRNEANTTATVTLILDQLGQTILKQYDELVKKDAELAELRAENVKMKDMLPPMTPVSTDEEKPNTSDNTIE